MGTTRARPRCRGSCPVIGYVPASAARQSSVMAANSLRTQCESIDSDGVGGGGGGGGGGEQGLSVPAVVARGGKIKVSLVLPGPGAVSVRAAARVCGRRIAVGRGVGTASAAGPLTVAIRPRAAARRALRAHRKLKVTVRVTFSPSGGGAAVKVARTVALKRRSV